MSDDQSFSDAQLPTPHEAVTDKAPAELRDRWTDLTRKQRLWLKHYIRSGLNATEAARKAYDVSDSNAAAIGYQNKNHEKLVPFIRYYTEEMIMPQPEALARLGQIATASMEDFLSKDENGNVQFDYDKAKRSGVLAAVKKIKVNHQYHEDGSLKSSRVDVQLYGKAKPLELVLQATGAFREEDEAAEEARPAVFQQVNQKIMEGGTVNMDREGPDANPSGN